MTRASPLPSYSPSPIRKTTKTKCPTRYSKHANDCTFTIFPINAAEQNRHRHRGRYFSIFRTNSEACSFSRQLNICCATCLLEIYRYISRGRLVPEIFSRNKNNNRRKEEKFAIELKIQLNPKRERETGIQKGENFSR